MVESHFIQVREPAVPDKARDQEFSTNIFEVFTAEKKKRGKAPELSAATPSASQPVPETSTPAAETTTNLNASRTTAQYGYQSNAENHHLIAELEGYLMQGKLSSTTPAHIFTASPAIRKNISEKL